MSQLSMPEKDGRVEVGDPKPSSEEAVRYILDAAASRFTVKAFAGGFLSAFAHNPTVAIREFTGEATVNAGQIESSSLRVSIAAASLQVVGDVPDKDRPEVERTMHDEVLESVRFPEIVYECLRLSANRLSEELYWASLNGDLTLHGVTRPLLVPARITMGSNRLKASGDFTIRQSDYDIKLVSASGGTIKVKDDLKFLFEIVARRQE